MFPETVNPIAAFLAGIISVLSPCILPLIPAIFAYSTEKGKLGPFAIILGLSISFTTMGIVTSAFGSTFGAYIGYLNILAEILIISMGIAMIFELNLFNVFGNMSSRLQVKEKGLFGGLLLGLSLGILWIPCVGPMLGSILTMVAVAGDVKYGALMLSIYSAGFAVPMFLIGYSANVSSSKLRIISKYDIILKKSAGLVVVAVGFWMAYQNHIIQLL